MKSRTRLILMLSCLWLINVIIQLAAFPVLARGKSSVAYMKQTMLVLLDPESNHERGTMHAPVQRTISTYERVWNRLDFCVSLSILMTIIIIGSLVYTVRQSITESRVSAPPPHYP